MTSETMIVIHREYWDAFLDQWNRNETVTFGVGVGERSHWSNIGEGSRLLVYICGIGIVGVATVTGDLIHDPSNHPRYPYRRRLGRTDVLKTYEAAITKNDVFGRRKIYLQKSLVPIRRDEFDKALRLLTS